MENNGMFKKIKISLKTNKKEKKLAKLLIFLKCEARKKYRRRED